MGAGLAALVVGQQRSRHPLRPPRFAVLAAVGDVDHPEDVPASGDVIHAHQQLPDEQILVRGGPEQPFQHVPSEQPALDRDRCAPPGLGRGRMARATLASGRIRQPRSISRWRSAKARSWTSGGTPARSRPARIWSHASSRTQPEQAARRSTTLRGYG